MRRVHSVPAVALVVALIAALLAASLLLHAWRTSSLVADSFDTFVGLAGLALPLCGLLWRRATAPDGGEATPRDVWLPALARAEKERIQDDLRFRGVEVAPIAVPWEGAPGLGAAPPEDAYGPSHTPGVDRLDELWTGLRPARLVVSGPAGSGKSIALELLAHRLLEEAGEAGAESRVPVVLSLAGWDARTRRPVHEWVAGQLADRYPEIVGPESGVTDDDLLGALRRDGAVVPFLDGFDEVAAPQRIPLLRALGQALGARLPVALTSREEQLGEAVRAAGALRGATAIRLKPLGPGHLAHFLSDSHAPNLAAWQPLLDAMRDGSAPAAAGAFATPLMQWLGLQVHGTGSADPGELLRRDSRATAAVAVCFAAASVLVSWSAWSLTAGRTPPAAFLVTAAGTAAVVGPSLFTAWPVFRAAHAWYALRGHLPLRFTDFMTSAHLAGVLREDGVTYRFRHALMHAALLHAGPAGTPARHPMR